MAPRKPPHTHLARRAGCALVLALGALVLAACGGGGSDSSTPSQPANDTLPRIEPYERTVTMSATLRSLVLAPEVRLAPPPIALGPLPAGERARGGGNARRTVIGAARAVAAVADADGMRQALDWQPLASGGQVAAVRIQADDAVALRLGVRVYELPAGAVLRAFGASGGGAVGAAEARAVLARNYEQGDLSEAASTYWLPIVHGSDATLQVELPPGVDPAQVQIAMPVVSHLWALPVSGDTRAGQQRSGSDTCEQDAVCSPQFDAEARSVAKLVFSDGGRSVLCSGSLMADVDRTGRPFLITANHCIGNQTQASSLQTYWFYRSSACNSGAESTATVQRTGGADLLYTSSVQDLTLLELTPPTARPPAGTVHAGSLVGAAALGSPVVGLHHPSGDLLKVSEGSTRGAFNCTLQAGDTISCQSTSAGGSSHWSVGWSRGITESGSSGSPLFVGVGSNRYFVGQLSGGGSSCSNPGASDYYGRFDRAYPSLRTWLGNAPGS